MPQRLTAAAFAFCFLNAGSALAQPSDPAPSLQSLFAAPTDDEITAAERRLRAARFEPQSAEIVAFIEREDAYVGVVRYTTADGPNLYGAFRAPTAERRLDSGPLPIIIVNHAGNEGVSGDLYFEALERGAPRLVNAAVLVLPSFRAEELRVSFGSRIYPSGGEAGVWRGDVEDALTLALGIALLLPNADATRIGAIGFSRGGTTALLLGALDNRIKAVVAFAAPADLLLPAAQTLAASDEGREIDVVGALRQSLLNPYLSGEIDLREARLRLIERSPAFFAYHLPPTLLFHDPDDPVVAHEHASRMCASMRVAGTSCRVRTIRGAGHNPLLATHYLSEAADWLLGHLRVSAGE